MSFLTIFLKAVLWTIRIAVGLALLLGVLIVVFRFVNPPSTLMLWRWLTGAPVERHWVPIETISPSVLQAVITSEDQLFCSHSGVDFDILRNLMSQPDGPTRGGSTIAMQTAKNVFLWPQRSYLRKAIEIPLAMTIDFVWGKRRVMEVYLNVAEWGDGVYGVEAAARRHFRKSADMLTPMEASRLAAALPNPIRRRPGMRSTQSQRVLVRMQAMNQWDCVRGH